MTSLLDALRTSIDALGGQKVVGHHLRPEMHPVLAGQWVAHCLDSERREKFSPEQMDLILDRAKAASKHDGFVAWAKSRGYHVTAVMDERDQIADLARKAEQAAKQAGELSQEVLERMRAAGIKMEAA